MALGPGLKKAKLPALLRERWVRLLALTEGRIRELVDEADIISEGGVREESGVSTYYGTTSLIIGTDVLEGASTEVITHVLRCDPHTRLRLVRVAHREATSRIAGRAGALSLEMEIDVTAQRITIRIDAVARVMSRHRAVAD